MKKLGKYELTHQLGRRIEKDFIVTKAFNKQEKNNPVHT